MNGRLCASGTATLQPTDRGILYGDGLFETIRVYGGVPFRLYDHWERLCEAATVLRFSLPLTAQDLEATVQQVLTANTRKDGTLRITVTRGAVYGGLDPHPVATPTVLISTAPLRSTLRAPCRVVTVGIRRDEASPLSRIKSLNYLPNILARFEVKDKGADEGLMLNTRGAVAEGTVSNIFWIKRRILFTPSVDCGILPGITRAVVMDSAEAAGLLTAEGAFDPTTLQNADAVFLTNSLIEIAPVHRLDDRTFDTNNHPDVAALQNAFRRRVITETGIS